MGEWLKPPSVEYSTRLYSSGLGITLVISQCSNPDFPTICVCGRMIMLQSFKLGLYDNMGLNPIGRTNDLIISMVESYSFKVVVSVRI